MEQNNIKFSKKMFPNVASSYGDNASQVILEMARYTKGPLDQDKITSLLVILENNLAEEKVYKTSKVSKKVPVPAAF